MVSTTIASTGELEKLSAPELVKLYNGLNPPNPVKRFSDKETAVRRCLSLLGAAQGSPKAPPPSSMPKGNPVRSKPLRIVRDDRPRPIQFDLKARPNIKPHRAGSKRGRVVELLSAPGGATFEDVMETIGWDRRTTYEGIKLLHVHLGYGLREDPTTHKIKLLKP